eukprot:246036_1
MSFKCTWPNCNKTFKRKQQLREHQRDHTGALYPCNHILSNGNVCRQSFNARYKLTQHEKIHQSIQCYTCGKTYNGRTYATHKCNVNPGPKPIHQQLSTQMVDNIKQKIYEQDNEQPYPLNNAEIKKIVVNETNKENINVFRETNTEHKWNQNISSIKTFTKTIGYQTRKNSDRRRIFKPITNRQILCRAKTDNEIFQKMSKKEYCSVQNTLLVNVRKKKRKQRKRARRDIDCSTQVLTLRKRQELREKKK